MTEERFDYGEGLIAYQRRCPAAGCEGGLLLSPVRFCPECGGSGYLVRWERDGEPTVGPC